MLRMRRDGARLRCGLPRMRARVRGMISRRVTTVLFDAGGVLLDLDYAFVKRLLDARHVATTIEELSASESIARTTIDRRVREGGRSSEAWRDYFRILLTRVGSPPEGTEEIIDTLAEAHQRVGLWTVAIEGAVQTVRALKDAGHRLGVVSNAEGRVERDLAGRDSQGCSRRSSTRTSWAWKSRTLRSSASRWSA